MLRSVISSIWNHRVLPGNLPQQHIIIVLGLSLILTVLISSGENNTQPATNRHTLPLTLIPGEALTTLAQGQAHQSAPLVVRALPKSAEPSTASVPPASTGNLASTAAAGYAISASTPPPQQPSIDANDSDILPSTTPSPTESIAWQTVTVRTGDSLSRLFQRVGLNDRDLHQLMRSNDAVSDLGRLYPGEQLAFQIESGVLQALRYIKSPLESLFIERADNAYQVSKALRTPEVRQRFSHAVIHDNLFKAGDRANLSHGLIMELANIFSGVIDFVYDPRRGDAFSVLYEELYLDGEKYDEGRIIAAYFTNRGTEYPAFLHTDGQSNTGYYNAEGVSMRKAFLRAPVDFTRISSHFDPARLHPIFKTRRPHRGIDYAAKRGTPVFSTGDGRVTQAGYSRANGNFLVIAHGNQFITKYLHLHKKQVRQGQRVKQGQIIGQVGSTGFATGPHLHYEFLLNGVHRNPRTIHKQLPKARSIAASELARFQADIAPLQARIDEYHRAQLLTAQHSTSVSAQ